MAKFQLLSCYVHLAGERSNVVFRGPDNPVTYPEALLLQAIHGGQEHVHTMIAVGEVERSHDEEFLRLQEKYGAVVKTAFPAVAGRVSLPQGDDALPTAEEMAASKAAAAEALEAAKAQRGKTDAPTKAPAKKAAKKAADADADNGGVPSLDELPK